MDMSKYAQVFLDEARDHIQRINDSLLALEADPQGNRTVLNEIFRSAHTLKGMSATMGYSAMAEFTHQMENLLQKLRNGEMEPGEEVMDILFASLDVLEKMMDDIAAGGKGEVDTSDLRQRMLALLEKGAEEVKPEPVKKKEEVVIEDEISFNEYESRLIIEGKKRGFQAYHITVFIRENCLLKAARAYMVFRNLEKLGEIVKTIPRVQDIEDEKFNRSFEVILLSNRQPEEIRQALVSIAEVEEPRIVLVGVEIKEESGATSPSPAQDEAAPAGKEKSGQIVCQDNRCELRTQKVRTVQTVRVDIDRLDTLMNMVGELVIQKTRLEQIGRQQGNSELNEALEQLGRLTWDLQNVVMKVRMVPLEHVFNRFPRMVRDLARELGKKVNFVVEGQETELDRTVIDEIGDPLVHLLRNALDHGLEPPEEREKAGKNPVGTVKLAARYEGNNVIIEVKDDGRGIDIEKVREKIVARGLLSREEAAQLSDEEVLNYLFQPGFSTAEKVTDISGRGVGLDVVKSKIESLSGSIELFSTPGKGTTFQIQLPLTLAIMQALMVQTGNEIYAIPLSYITETTNITPGDIKVVQNQETMILRDHVLPLIRLHEYFEVPEEPRSLNEYAVVVVKKGEKKVGLVVDQLLGQQEIVIKSLGNSLPPISALAGATILGNGQVALIIDVPSLF